MTRPMILILAAALAAMTGTAGAAEMRGKGRNATPASPRLCEKVQALATGFGQENVTSFANGNLDLAIDSAKNRLADKGAKGFTVRKRRIACADYIDFGGAIGREHKCTASAELCGNS